VLRDIVVDDKLAISKAKIKDKLVEFNIYYDKFGVPLKKEIKNQNYFKIQVHVDKLKKYEPNLPAAYTKEDLKEMISEITKSFSIGDNGDLLVDASKIDPSAITIMTRHMMNFTKKELDANESSKKKLRELEKILGRNPAPLTVLFKTAKIFNRTHYLMIIYRQESIIGEDELSSLANYEQYNISYIIELKNLSNSSDTRPQLEFSESQVRSLFGLTEAEEICRFFAKKLNLFNDNVILPVVKKLDLTEVLDFERRHIVFYYAKALELITRYLANRKFLAAFNRFKRELAKIGDNRILRQAVHLENNWYHAVVYLASEKKNFKAVLWNAKTYAEYRLKVSQDFSAPYLKVAPVFAEVLLKSLFFVADPSDRLVLRYNFKAVPDKVSKALALRLDKKPRLPVRQ
jgi:hypothetical protein